MPGKRDWSSESVSPNVYAFSCKHGDCWLALVEGWFTSRPKWGFFCFQKLLGLLVCFCWETYLFGSCDLWLELRSQGARCSSGEEAASHTCIPGACDYVLLCVLLFPWTSAHSTFALKQEGAGGPLWESRGHRGRRKKGWRGCEMKPRMGFCSYIREPAYPGCCAKSGLKKKKKVWPLNFFLSRSNSSGVSLATISYVDFFVQQHLNYLGEHFFFLMWIDTTKWILTSFCCLIVLLFVFVFFFFFSFDIFQEITPKLCAVFEWSILRPSFLFDDRHFW